MPNVSIVLIKKTAHPYGRGFEEFALKGKEQTPHGLLHLAATPYPHGFGGYSLLSTFYLHTSPYGLYAIYYAPEYLINYHPPPRVSPFGRGLASNGKIKDFRFLDRRDLPVLLFFVEEFPFRFLYNSIRILTILYFRNPYSLNSYFRWFSYTTRYFYLRICEYLR